MRYPLDLATWPRREHFEFFSTYDEPFFSLVVEIDCTPARDEARRLGVPFFLYYLYHAVQAANAVAEFRYRIEQGQVYAYDQIHASATIGRPDHTFGFAFIKQQTRLADFAAGAQTAIAAVQAISGLNLTEDTARPDVLHCSAVPWLRFTGLTHSRSFRLADSVPKLSFGQVHTVGASQLMPVAVSMHHALADGYHVSQFLEQFQQRLASKTA